MTTEQDSKTET